MKFLLQLILAPLAFFIGINLLFIVILLLGEMTP